jgi:dTDP-glucose 4,6-dehydratase
MLNESRDIKIINLDKMSYGSNPKNLKEYENDPRYEFMKGDIADCNLIERLIKSVDAVVNIAAETHVDRSIANSEGFLRSNTIGVFSLLEAIRKVNREIRFIQVSIDEVYGEIRRVLLRRMID